MSETRLLKLQQFASTLSQGQDVSSLLDMTARIIPELISCERASIALVHHEQPELFRVYALTGNKAIPMGAQIPLEGASVGLCIQTGESILTENLVESGFTDCLKLSQHGLKTCINAPLSTGGVVIGTLNVAHVDERAYSEQELEFLSQVALILAVNIESRRLVGQLAESFKLKQLMLDTVEHGFAIVTEDGVLSEGYSNILARWFGVPDNQPLWSWLEPVDPQFSARLRDDWSKARAAELPTMLYYNGRTYQFSWHALAGHARMVMSIQDVTETQLRLKAEKESREKTSFLTTMSHELRTPLNAIIGYSELIHEEVGDDDVDIQSVRSDLENIRNSGMHLLRLIDDILDVSKIERGEFRVKPEQTSLNELTRILAQSMRVILEEDNTFALNVPQADVVVHTDPIRVRQILWNLLSNAAKFTSSGHISLTVEALDDGAAITVQDNGVGIPAGALNTIFDRFEQVDATATRRYDGAGLGLSICSKLSVLLGGDISVVSQINEGSTFRLFLPRTCPAQDRASV